MASTHNDSMPQAKFLHLSVNLLHRALLEPGRTEVKRLFRELVEGRDTPLARVEMEDGASASFNLALDHSEFRGRLNFGAFRTSLVTLLKNITDALGESKELKVFGAQQDSGAVIFGVTAVTVENGMPNVMVLSADSGSGATGTTLRLLYLDPGQFQRELSGQPD